MSRGARGYADMNEWVSKLEQQLRGLNSTKLAILQVDFARERERDRDCDEAHELTFRYFSGENVPKEKYQVVWEKELWEIPGGVEALLRATTVWDFLEWVFRYFNRVEPGDVPEDFAGHSLSVGDVVRLTQGDVIRYYKVMPLGFEEVTNRWNAG